MSTTEYTVSVNNFPHIVRAEYPYEALRMARREFTSDPTAKVVLIPETVKPRVSHNFS